MGMGSLDEERNALGRWDRQENAETPLVACESQGDPSETRGHHVAPRHDHPRPADGRAEAPEARQGMPADARAALLSMAPVRPADSSTSSRTERAVSGLRE